jgi:hypothetical protein
VRAFSVIEALDVVEDVGFGILSALVLGAAATLALE